MKNWKSAAALLIAAVIWGTAFVAQTTGGDAIGPYAFNSIRNFIGALVLIPVIKIFGGRGTDKKTLTREDKKRLNVAGLVCGTCLAVAGLLQQVGMYMGTEAGKAGFLTTCYIILVPIFGIFIKKNCPWNVWAAVVITLVGLYLLCLSGKIGLQGSDVIVLLCAVVFAVHILAIDHFVETVDPIRLSQRQFLVAGCISLVPAFIVDMGHSMEGIRAWLPGLCTWDAWSGLLFAGVMSSGVAYTLQIVGQKGLNPTLASLLMSLESVFSVLAGWLILGQVLSGRELTGCLIIFAAVVLAQIPIANIKSGRV